MRPEANAFRNHTRRLLTVKITHTPYRCPRRQSGMTLIEILVALLIFSFGLLGFVGLQARAIQYSTSSEDSNRAALAANEIAAAMQLQQTVSLPASAVSAWQGRVTTLTAAGGLPNATATITATAASQATITITWRANSASGANSTNQYVTQVILP